MDSLILIYSVSVCLLLGLGQTVKAAPLPKPASICSARAQNLPDEPTRETHHASPQTLARNAPLPKRHTAPSAQVPVDEFHIQAVDFIHVGRDRDAFLSAPDGFGAAFLAEGKDEHFTFAPRPQTEQTFAFKRAGPQR